MPLQPVLMWQERDVCPYSNLFFSGLRMIATPPASRIVTSSTNASPMEAESSRTAEQSTHHRSTSISERSYPQPGTAVPRIDTDSKSVDRRPRRPRDDHSTPSRHIDGHSHRRAPIASSSPSSGRPMTRDSDRDSIDTELEQLTSPLTSFLSFNHSDSTVSLVSPRERRPSLESTKTVPLPPKRRRSEKRRSIMSVDIRPPSPQRSRAVTASKAQYSVQDPRSSVGVWTDEVTRDWRRRVDSPSLDDRSFLITS